MLPQPLIKNLLADSPTKIAFDKRRCLRSRFNKNNCQNCLDACQSNALDLHGRQVIFTAENCTNCMQCTAVCPNDAFGHTVNLIAILKNLADKETISFSCKNGADNHITIPCVGLFSEPLLVAVNSVAKGNCFIDVSQCDECLNSHCLQTLRNKTHNFTKKIMGRGKIRVKCQFDKQPVLPTEKTTKRRSFLLLVGKKITDMGKEAICSQPAVLEKTKNHHSKNKSKKSAALQYALSITPEKRIEEKKVLLSYFFSVTTNKQCNCCPSCTGMCPTGALKRKKENNKRHLVFNSSNCSGCGLCVSFCRKSALILERGFSGDPNTFLTVAENKVQNQLD